MTFAIAVSEPSRAQPHLVDRHVGERVRLHRRALGMSQGALAEKLGVTFQQVQKYERGANRISASKLYEIGHALSTPVAVFFEGLPAAEGGEVSSLPGVIDTLLACPQGSDVALTFPRIASDRVRQAVVRLLCSLSGQADDPSGHTPAPRA